mgnify:CR=1 FL=1
MVFDFVVLGATGMQGRIVSRDLLEGKYSVLMCGRDKRMVERLLKKYKKTRFEFFDLKNVSQTTEILKKSGAKVVINCVEGDWNLNGLEAATRAGMHSLDLGSDIEMTKEQKVFEVNESRQCLLTFCLLSIRRHER